MSLIYANNLKWTTHIDQLCTGKGLSILEYGSIISDKYTLEQCSALEKVQYETARIVTDASKLVSLQKLLDEVGRDTLKSRRQKHKLLLLYQMGSNLTPSYLPDLCPPTIENETYFLRNREDLRAPRARTSLYYDSFLPATFRAFNELPISLRNAATVSSFKRELFTLTNIVTPYF